MGAHCGALRLDEVRRNVEWLLVLNACGCGCVCMVGCFGLVDNKIGDEGCAALARALEGGTVPQLSSLVLAGMYFGGTELEGLVV